MIKVGTKVTWTTASGVKGSGVVISIAEPGVQSDDSFNAGHVVVAVDAPTGEEHRMIYCAETWLTPISS